MTERAIKVFNVIANSMGGVDWAGFGLACELYQVEDIEDMMRAVLIVKGYAPPKKEG